MSRSLAVRTLESQARRIARAAVEHAGERAVRAVILGGGVPEGDVVAVEADGVTWILSDVDVYVVVRDRERADRMRGERDAWLPRVVPSPDVVLVRGADVGVDAEVDFAAQADRPGTRVLLASGRVVLGDARVLEAWRTRMHGPLPREEALVLVEHRLLEWRRAHADPFDAPADARAKAPRVASWLEALARLKLAEAAVDALRIAAGTWTPGAASRRDAARRMREDATLDAPLRTVARVVARVRDRSSWVASGGSDVDAAVARAAAVGAWRHAARACGVATIRERVGARAMRARARTAGRIARRLGRGRVGALVDAAYLARIDVPSLLRAAALMEAVAEMDRGAAGRRAGRELERLARVVRRLGATPGDDVVGAADRLYRRLTQ